MSDAILPPNKLLIFNFNYYNDYNLFSKGEMTLKTIKRNSLLQKKNNRNKNRTYLKQKWVNSKEELRHFFKEISLTDVLDIIVTGISKWCRTNNILGDIMMMWEPKGNYF
nr:hypothetical protein [Entomoplasma sp. MP1]